MIVQLELELRDLARLSRFVSHAFECGGVAHAQHATPDAVAPDYPCPCGARSGEFCGTCRSILSRPVGGDQECTCDVCTSED